MSPVCPEWPLAVELTIDIKGIKKPSTQLYMCHLMQHVSILQRHLENKVHDKTHKRLHTMTFIAYDLKAILCNCLCVLACTSACLQVTP